MHYQSKEIPGHQIALTHVKQKISPEILIIAFNIDSPLIFVIPLFVATIKIGAKSLSKALLR